MDCRVFVQDGSSPHLRFFRGDLAPVTRDWRRYALEAVNDNVPDRQAVAAHAGQCAGQAVLGGGPE
jgi:hypothetical protein